MAVLIRVISFCSAILFPHALAACRLCNCVKQYYSCSTCSLSYSIKKLNWENNECMGGGVQVFQKMCLSFICVD